MIVIVGLGSQAKAWCLNLRDSGQKVVVALRNFEKHQNFLKKNKIDFIKLDSENIKNYKNFILLTPDHTHSEILEKFEKDFQEGSQIIYAHGYSVISNKLYKRFPLWDHLLLAPKAIASEVRFNFETHGKLGAVYSAEFAKDEEASSDFLKSLAKDLGITGLFKSSFKEETYADLFSEQGLLCSLLPYGALSCFRKLREKNISKEVAFMECWLEVQLIANAMVKLGPEEFFSLISPNALLGGEKAKELLLGENFQNSLDQLMEDIWSEKFFKECQDVSFSDFQNKVLQFWQDQEISQVYKNLKGKLINP